MNQAFVSTECMFHVKDVKNDIDGAVLLYGHLGALEMQSNSAARCLRLAQQTGFTRRPYMLPKTIQMYHICIEQLSVQLHVFCLK